MLVTRTKYFGQSVIQICDARCDKAWGVHSRPIVTVGERKWWIADDEQTAPADPETYEGNCAKPTTPEHRHNTWCTRECERSLLVGEDDERLKKEVQLPEWGARKLAWEGS